MMPSARFCPAERQRGERRVQLVRDAGHELELLQTQPLRAARHERERDGHRAEEDEDQRGDGDLAAALRGDASASDTP